MRACMGARECVYVRVRARAIGRADLLATKSRMLPTVASGSTRTIVPAAMLLAARTSAAEVVLDEDAELEAVGVPRLKRNLKGWLR